MSNNNFFSRDKSSQLVKDAVRVTLCIRGVWKGNGLGGGVGGGEIGEEGNLSILRIPHAIIRYVFFFTRLYTSF